MFGIFDLMNSEYSIRPSLRAIHLGQNQIGDFLKQRNDPQALAVVLGARPRQADAVHHRLYPRLDQRENRLALDLLQVFLQRQ